MEDWWKRKLFNPRDIEGEPVKEQLDYVRELFELARKKDSRLKGVTIVGSTLKGYSSPRGEHISDTDITIIYDRPQNQGVDDLNIYESIHDSKIELNSTR